MSRRDQIVMSDAEVLAFLDEQRIVTCASIGRDGRPHLMPLWYVVRDGAIWGWTYGKSQKIRNLERDRRATLQIEAGATTYAELRGVMIEADCVIHRNADTITEVGAGLMARYAGADSPNEDLLYAARAQAAKRVAMEFSQTRRVTWDHRKLDGY